MPRKRGPVERSGGDVPAAKQSGPKRARLKLPASDVSNHASLLMALENQDIGKIILSFLDIKSLYAISRTRKSFKDIIEYDHVVRSAAFRGGSIQISMANIVSLLRNDKIWTPSVHRLLRLIVGKHCEKCNKGKPVYVSELFGVRFCGGCMRDCCVKVVSYQKWQKALDHPRASGEYWSGRGKLWKNDCIDSTAERAGPFLCAHLHFRNDQPLDDFLVEIEEQDPNRINREKIIESYAQCINLAKKRLKAEEKQRRNARKKRALKARELVETLNTMLGDAPLKGQILAYTVRDKKWFQFIFHCRFMEEMMGAFVRAPSKVTRKKVKQLVDDTLLPALKALDDFFRFKFLEDAIADSKSQFEHSLLVHVKNSVTATFPEGSQTLLHFKESFNLLMVDTILSPGNKFEKSFAVLRALHGDKIVDTLASFMVSTALLNEFSPNDDEHLLSLAKTLLRVRSLDRIYFGPHCKETDQYLKNSADLTQEFELCTKDVPRLYRTAQDFLEAPETTEWVEENNVCVSKLKQYAFCGEPRGYKSVDVLECLENKDFDKLKETVCASVTHTPWSRQLLE